VADGVKTGEFRGSVDAGQFGIKMFNLLEGTILACRVLHSKAQMKMLADMLKVKFMDLKTIKMKAIQFTEYGSYDKLKLVDLHIPVLQDGQLLVKVKLAAVNPVDNTIRSGLIPQAKKPPMILGNEGAGVVVRGNSAFPDGTRVIISGFTPQER